MSQRNRIVFAAVALVAALCLVTPSPSHAAGLRSWNIPAMDAWERVWNRLAGLLPSGAVRKPPARQEKEGSAINPNGGTTSGTTAPTLPAIPSGEPGTK
jgi:hypothetical protein